MAAWHTDAGIIRILFRSPGNIAADCPVFSVNRSRRGRKSGVRVRFLVQWLIDRPRRVAAYLTWLAPLFARITVGWVFLWSGWGKLHNLAQVTDNFTGWGIPHPQLLTPFVSGVEFFGGLFLLLGVLTRISAGALGVTMIVAIRAAKWAEVDSLETLLGFDEFEYLALFLWLAIAGPGAISLDTLLQRWYDRGSGRTGVAVRSDQPVV
jgi:putative oxidoreductase